MKRHILINASNLHTGGGVQVATSIVDELSQSRYVDNISLALSSIVMESCRNIGTDLSNFRQVTLVDVRGFEPTNVALGRLIRAADVVFTVFGPLYSIRRPKRSIVGFAQPWIIYPKSEAYFKLPFGEKLLLRAKYFLQRIAFARNSDLLVVEADHVRRQLKARLPATPSVVVPNALNAVFLQAIKDLPSASKEIPQLTAEVVKARRITLGYVGRAYSHKNIAILPSVLNLLREKHQLNVTIMATLNDAEWAAQSEEFRREIENAGSMSLKELVVFYRSLSGIIFPSLLECFSATPLEAMAMELPLFASDRAFIRDFCSDFPFYFDPVNPESIADAVAHCFDCDPDALDEHLRAGRVHVLGLPTAADRAQKTLDLLLSA